MKTHEIKKGARVAFNNLPDAVWFDVVEVNGFNLTVRESGTANATQSIDKSLVKQIAA